MQINKLQNEAHIWLTIPENVKDTDTITQYYSILSKQETEQYHRFHFPEDKHRYLVSHALARHVLSKYINKQPSKLNFYHSDHGKPQLSLSQNDPPIRFNLSHTKRLTACIVTIKDDCGIDTEKITYKTSLLDIARLMFSDCEHQFLERISGQQFLEEFYIRWTLREAYVKALGYGIGYPTNKLAFDVKNHNDIKISYLDNGNNFASQTWQFEIIRPTPDHIVTAAIYFANKAQNRNMLIKWWT